MVRATPLGLFVAGYVAWFIQLGFGSGARPRLLLALTLLPVLMAAASVAPLLYLALEWGECGAVVYLYPALAAFFLLYFEESHGLK